MKTKSKLAAIVLAAVATGFAQIPAAAQDSNEFNGNTIVGTWDSIVTIVNCANGAPLISVPTMNTFNQGGTMLETSTSLATRSPGHGVWNRVSGNEYGSVFKFFRTNPDGSFGGYQVIRRKHVLTDGILTTTAVFQIYTAAGIPGAQLCATETATRLE